MAGLKSVIRAGPESAIELQLGVQRKPE